MCGKDGSQLCLRIRPLKKWNSITNSLPVTGSGQVERTKQTWTAMENWSTSSVLTSPHRADSSFSGHLEDGTPEPLGHLGLVQKQCGASKTCSRRNGTMSWLPKVSTVPTSGQSNCMLAFTPGRTGWGDSLVDKEAVGTYQLQKHSRGPGDWGWVHTRFICWVSQTTWRLARDRRAVLSSTLL
jgi:hypothetical protein